MYPTIREAFPKSGIPSIIVPEVRHGPSKSGGAGILSLLHCMGTARMSLLVEHSYRNTPLGRIIRVCIEDIVLDDGLHCLLCNILFEDITKYVDKNSWTFTTLEYSHKFKIKIVVDHGKGCCAIIAQSLGYYSSLSDIRSLNRIRLSFQVDNENIMYVNILLTRALDRFTRKQTVRLQTDRPVTSVPSVSHDVIRKDN